MAIDVAQLGTVLVRVRVAKTTRGTPTDYYHHIRR
jgi:hypothetical protein